MFFFHKKHYINVDSFHLIFLNIWWY